MQLLLRKSESASELEFYEGQKEIFGFFSKPMIHPNTNDLARERGGSIYLVRRGQDGNAEFKELVLGESVELSRIASLRATEATTVLCCVAMFIAV